MKENRMRFPGIRSPQQAHIRVFHLAIRTRPPTCSEYRRQTGDAGRMSSPIAAVYVVAAHHAANEFLRCIVEFIRSLGAAEHAEIARIVLRDGLAKCCNNAVQGLIPSSRTMGNLFAYQGLRKATFYLISHSAREQIAKS